MKPFQLKRSTRLRIADRDGWRCWYCGLALHMNIPEVDRADTSSGEWMRHPSWRDYGTIDHLTPQHQGGGHELTNLVLACRSCNNRKKNRTVEQFRALVQSLSREARAIALLDECLNLMDTPYDHEVILAIRWLEAHLQPVVFYGEREGRQ